MQRSEWLKWHKWLTACLPWPLPHTGGVCRNSVGAPYLWGQSPFLTQGLDVMNPLEQLLFHWRKQDMAYSWVESWFQPPPPCHKNKTEECFPLASLKPGKFDLEVIQIWKDFSKIRSSSSVQSLSRVWLSVTHGLQHARPPCPSPTPRVYSISCPLSQWCHPTISSSVVPFSSCLQFFPAPGSFQMSQFFASGGQSIEVSASTSTSVLPMNIQDWFPLGWTGWISLQSKGLTGVFSNTTVQKHQFFGAQLSL